MLGDEDQHRIAGLDGCPHEAGAIRWGRWHDNLQPRYGGKLRFVTLAVPDRTTGKVGSAGRIDHHRAIPVAEAPPAGGGQVADELIPCRGDEVDELERLRRENLRLKRQLEEKDMVVELLKKVKEFERM